ncbi:MAG: TolC family protein [Planctomycetaceae bacterium]
MTIDTLEAMALKNNPTLAQATAQVRAARGAAYQAGRYLNPVIGYTSDQIGVSGTAGEFQGGFIAQEFVTAGKLRISREKYAQRARIAETNLQAQQQRVFNDVRIAFYRAAAAQRLVEIHRQLLANGEDNLQTHKEMLNLGQTNQAGLLQAEVDLQRDRLNLQAAQNSFLRTWRDLVSLVGVPDLAPQPLADHPGPGEGPLAWDAALNQLLTHSPELIAAWEKVRHDQIAVRRERVEPIPNILVDARVGRNFETRETVSGVSVGIPLPIYDRNRGTVRQALADLARSQAETRRLELELRTRLAAHYRDYQTAWQHVEGSRTIMLPKAKKAYDLLHAGYKKRRVAWPAVLRAQRRHLDLQAEYTNNLLRYREADVAIRGMLLTGGLTEPAGPISGGHIDATPKPR